MLVCLSVCECVQVRCVWPWGREGNGPHLHTCDSEQLFWVTWFRGLELLKAKERCPDVSAEVNLLKGKPTYTWLYSYFCGTT